MSVEGASYRSPSIPTRNELYLRSIAGAMTADDGGLVTHCAGGARLIKPYPLYGVLLHTYIYRPFPRWSLRAAN
eukprot:6211312-Pleurochrysis_carterae.AAC.1